MGAAEKLNENHSYLALGISPANGKRCATLPPPVKRQAPPASAIGGLGLAAVWTALR